MRRWTINDDRKLAEMYDNGQDDDDMARELERSKKAIQQHRYALGIYRRRETSWSNKDILALLGGATKIEGKTATAIKMKRFHLRNRTLRLRGKK